MSGALGFACYVYYLTKYLEIFDTFIMCVKREKLSLLYVCASYTWALAGGALSLLRQKRARLLAAFVPALMSLGVCMLGPVNDYFRYFLPIVAMTPSLLGLCCRGSDFSS